MIEGRCARVQGPPAMWRMGPVYFDEWVFGAGAVCVPLAMAEGDNPHQPGRRCTVVRLAMLREGGVGEGALVVSHRDTSLSRLLERGVPTGRVLARRRGRHDYYDVDVVQTRLEIERRARAAAEGWR